MSKRLVQSIVFTLALALVATASLLLDFWPHRPSSVAGWIVLAVVALPASLLAEWLGYKLLHNRASGRLLRATTQSRFSGWRVAYLLGVMLIAVTLVAAAASLLWGRQQ